MKVHKAKNFTKGWFIGDFNPTLLSSREFEAAIKFYVKGDCESAHMHKIAAEFTVIGSGKFKMNERVLSPGDIVEVAPGEAADFTCLEDGVTFVIKSPSVPNDKYPVKR